MEITYLIHCFYVSSVSRIRPRGLIFAVKKELPIFSQKLARVKNTPPARVHIEAEELIRESKERVDTADLLSLDFGVEGLLQKVWKDTCMNVTYTIAYSDDAYNG